MLGGGNPVSSNPAGTGSNINYIGNHAYLYSGVVGVDNNETTLFEASIAQNQYIVAKLQIFNGSESNDNFIYKIKINGEIVMQYTLGQLSTSLYSSDEPLELILVGGSKIEVTAINVGVSSREHTATLTGVVYA